MEFEHFAINVKEPIETAAWYVQHMGMTIVFHDDSPPHMTFLADSTGRVVLELYSNSAAAIPNYQDQHHLILHFAFKVSNATSESERLLQAGCSHVETINKPDGSELIMLRDPWGLALQLCQRATPLAK